LHAPRRHERPRLDRPVEAGPREEGGVIFSATEWFTKPGLARVSDFWRVAPLTEHLPHLQRRADLGVAEPLVEAMGVGAFTAGIKRYRRTAAVARPLLGELHQPL